MRSFFWLTSIGLLLVPLLTRASPAQEHTEAREAPTMAPQGATPGPKGAPWEDSAVPSREGPKGWEQVSLPGGTVLVSLRGGIRGPLQGSGEVEPDAHGDLVAIGLTDRITIRPLGLGLAVRLGVPSTLEVLLSTHSGIGGANGTLLWFPTWDAQAILPLGSGQRFVVGGAVTTPVGHDPKYRDDDGRVFGKGYGAWTTAMGGRWYASFGASVGRESGRMAWGSDKPENFVELGAVAGHGGAPLPTISYRIFDSFSLDGLVTLRIDDERTPRARVLAGFGYWH